jgi:hypothetical protein
MDLWKGIENLVIQMDGTRAHGLDVILMLDDSGPINEAGVSEDSGSCTSQQAHVLIEADLCLVVQWQRYWVVGLPVSIQGMTQGWKLGTVDAAQLMF